MGKKEDNNGIAGLVEDAWDVHVHSAPSLFERELSAEDTVKLCRGAGMSGIILKAHHGSTVEAASVLNSLYGDFAVYGGLVLNYFTGGLNTDAVGAAIRLGAKIVWLPTIHAQAHKDSFGVLGTFPFQESSVNIAEKEGISLLDSDGALREEVKEILRIMDAGNAVLATGHVSYEEIRSVCDHIKKEDLYIKLLVSHSFFKTPDLDPDKIKKISSKNVWFEVSNFSLTSGTDPGKVAEAILALPDARWVISSDSGQKDKPLSPQALVHIMEALEKEGISKDILRRMVKDEPEKLLG